MDCIIQTYKSYAAGTGHSTPSESRGNPQKGREAATLSNIKEIQEIQGGQEAPHDGNAINPKDA
jgi:hypothetical protein